MNCALDTNILVWGSREGSDPKTKDLERRARILFELLERDKARVIVPSIVLAEFLVGVAPEEHTKVMEQFRQTFYCPPFDVAASVIAADLWRKHATYDPKDKQQRKILKADVLIIATAKVAGAQCFYTHDDKCRKLASEVMEARDLPTHDERLFPKK